MRELLIDTNVLIDYLRDRPQAVEFIESIVERFSISAISVSELYAGVREGRERDLLDILVSQLDVIEVTEEIAVQGGLFQRQYSRSHGVGLADAVIAATAQIGGLELVTLNRKHFPMSSDVVVPYRRM